MRLRTVAGCHFNRVLLASLRFILRLRRVLRLPLHIARRIRPTAVELDDVVDDIAGAGT